MICIAFKKRRYRCNKGGNLPFHVGCAAPDNLAVFYRAGKRRNAPCVLISRGHHIGVAGKTKVRTRIAFARKKIRNLVGSSAPFERQIEYFKPHTAE